jgi:hypothetical protein
VGRVCCWHNKQDPELMALWDISCQLAGPATHMLLAALLLESRCSAP